MLKLEFPPTDPLSTFRVVLTAYDTTTSRMIMTREQKKLKQYLFYTDIPDRLGKRKA